MTADQALTLVLEKTGTAYVAVRRDGPPAFSGLSCQEFGGNPVSTPLLYRRKVRYMAGWKTQIKLLEQAGVPMADRHRNPDRTEWEIWEVKLA